MNAAQHDLGLPGCTPEPLMAYLKALGILRLVAEQKDEGARGWWKNDVFWLRSSLNRDALAQFFLEEYAPTPILAPWAGGSGFFRKDNKQAVKALSDSKSPRIGSYARAIASVHVIIRDENIGDKPGKEDKVRLIQRYRRDLPDEVVAWMDAAMVLQLDGQDFAPLLGTGGNDGRLDFTQNFMQRIVTLGLDTGEPADAESRSWLELCLFGIPAKLDSASVGQFAPGRAGGPNATQGMEGGSSDNPWDFVLMLEGALSFAGTAGRRLGAGALSRAAFPFTVRPVAAGFDSATPRDEGESRGELWLPVWTRPTSTNELRQLLGEGRSDVSGRSARDGVDFARAVAGLGVDRGITEFSRLAFLKRSGKAFLAAPLGRFRVAECSGVDLIRAVDPWLVRFRSACSAKDAPPRLRSALYRIDCAIFAFCKFGGAPLFQEIVVALGLAERALANGERFREQKRLPPIPPLPPGWGTTANDGSAEFAIARSLTSVRDPEAKIGPFRTNLEPVDWRKECRRWAERDRAVVWNEGRLTTNLAGVLQRRLMDGARAGCKSLPLASRSAVPLHVISTFVAGKVDDERIEELAWGLMLVHEAGRRRHMTPAPGDRKVPRAYALLKLLFLPRPLVVESRTGRGTFARLLRDNESGGVAIRPEPSVLHLLRGGRLGEACVIAMRRLRAAGLDPMPRPFAGRGIRDAEWQELDHTGRAGIDPRRLAAALLIPITDPSVGTLVRLVIRGDETGNNEGEAAAAPSFEGDTLS